MATQDHDKTPWVIGALLLLVWVGLYVLDLTGVAK